jgi:hypothetical protein
MGTEQEENNEVPISSQIWLVDLSGNLVELFQPQNVESSGS